MRHRAGDLESPGLEPCSEASERLLPVRNRPSPGWTCGPPPPCCSRQGLKSSHRHIGLAVWRLATRSAYRRGRQIACDGPAIDPDGDGPHVIGLAVEVIKGSCSRLRQQASRYFLPAADRMQHRIVISPISGLFYTVFKGESMVSMGQWGRSREHNLSMGYVMTTHWSPRRMTNSGASSSLSYGHPVAIVRPAFCRSSGTACRISATWSGFCHSPEICGSPSPAGSGSVPIGNDTGADGSISCKQGPTIRSTNPA